MLAGIGLLLAVTGTAGATGTQSIPPTASTGPQTLTSSTTPAFVEFFLQSGSSWKGDLTGIGPTSASTPWRLEILGIDVTGVTGPADRQVYFNLQDADNGSAFQNLGLAIHLDSPGTGGGDLLQSLYSFGVGSSHGFNPGDLTRDEFDLRVDFYRSSNWSFDPYYRLKGGSWQPFYDGPWTCGGNLDFNSGKLVIAMDWGSTGTVSIRDMSLSAVPEPVTLAGLVLGVGSLVGYVRRRRG